MDRSRKGLKTGYNAEDARRRREISSMGLRRSRREELAAKKRREVMMGNAKQQNMPFAKDLSDLRKLPELVESLYSENPEMQLESTIDIRRLLSGEKNPPIRDIIESNCLLRLVTFLGSPDKRLVFEAAWIITNLSSGASEYTIAVIESGAVGPLIELINHDSIDVADQAIWALGNIAGDTPACRDFVLNNNIVPTLVNRLSTTTKEEILKNGAWTISNLSRGSPQPDMSKLVPVLDVLRKLLYSKHSQILIDVSWSLFHLSNGTNSRIEEVMRHGVTAKLVELLSHSDDRVKTPVLRTIGNFVSGNEHHTEKVLSSGVLPLLTKLLSSKHKMLVKESCWALSNITAGTKGQIQQVIDCNIIPPLNEIMIREISDIKKEAAWVVANACAGGDQDQVEYIVHQGVIPQLCELLKADDDDLLLILLEAIERILKIGLAVGRSEGISNPYANYIIDAGGAEYLENLQYHKNSSVFKKVYAICDTYFEAYDVDEEQMNMENEHNDMEDEFGYRGDTSFQFH